MLTIDVAQFKAAFRQRKRETSFERANRAAEAAKAAAWEAYVPIAPRRLWKGFLDRDDDSSQTLKRALDETELMAYLHATGKLWFEGELLYPVVLRDAVMLWHCRICDTKKPINQFPRIKVYPGYRHACNECVAAAAGRVWTDKRKAA